MSTKKDPPQAPATKPGRSRRRAPDPPDETPPPEIPPADETPPSEATEAIVVRTAPQTCVFCNQIIQVDTEELAGGRFISEPALGIRHYVCEGCNGA